MKLAGTCIRCGACCRPPVTINGVFCAHFIDGSPATCAIHDRKPDCCRNYPRAGVGVYTRLDPVCGYYYVDD